MKKIKIIYSIILVILIGFILTLYNALNGNPISNFIGRKVAQNYLEETYPGEEFRVETGSYDFKFGEYHYDVIRIGVDPYANNLNADDPTKERLDLNYYVTVQGFFTPHVRHDGVRYERIDTSLSERIGGEASVEILELLQSDLPNIKAVDVNVEILRSTFTNDIKWSKNMQLDHPISMHIVTDGTNQSAEEALADGKKIQQLLNDNVYNYSNVTINTNAFDKDLGAKDDYGYVKYAFSFTPETKLTLKDIEELNKNLK